MKVPQQIARSINPFMKEHGFFRKSLCFYKFSNDIAFCIELLCPSELIYVHCYIMPLYIPTPCRHFSYGNRLSEIVGNEVEVLSVHCTMNEITAWIIKLCESLQHNVFPFFDRIGNPEKLAKYALSSECNKEHYFFCPKLQLYRLAYYTYSYRGCRELAINTYNMLSNEIKGANYLIESIKTKYIDEINIIESLSLDRNDKLNNFFSTIIESVAMSCFNRKV